VPKCSLRAYTHLREGIGKAEALRQAQIEVRQEYSNPFYWAAFVLSGDGGEVSRREVSVRPPDTAAPLPRWVWLIVGGGTLIVIIVGVVLWRG
jgi:hypothetical protein